MNDQRILPFATETIKEAIESTFKDNNTEIRRNYVDKQNGWLGQLCHGHALRYKAFTKISKAMNSLVIYKTFL